MPASLPAAGSTKNAGITGWTVERAACRTGLCWKLGAIEERHIRAVKNDYLLGAGFS